MFGKSVKINTIKERVFNMAASFAKSDRKNIHVKTYQKLDQQIKEASNGTARKVGKKKNG